MILLISAIIPLGLLIAFFCADKKNPIPHLTEQQAPDTIPEPSYIRTKREYLISRYILIGLFCIIFVLPYGCGVWAKMNYPNDPTASQGAGWLMIFLLFVLSPVLFIAFIVNTIFGITYYWKKMKTPKEERLKWEEFQQVEKKRRKQQAEQSKKEEKGLKKPNFISPVLQAVIDKNERTLRTTLAEHPEFVNTPYAANGNTPLHVAVWNEHKDIVEILLQQPTIDSRIKNNEGKTALDLAKEKKLTGIIQLLEDTKNPAC